MFFTNHFRNENVGIDGPLECVMEPPFKIRSTIYRCSNKICTEPLWKQAKNSQGNLIYVIIDASDILIALVSVHEEKVLYHKNNNAPSKHGRGGQSASRFERIRTEKV